MMRQTISDHYSIPNEEEEKCPICFNTGWMPKSALDGREVYVDCSCGIRKKEIMSGKLKFAEIPDAYKNLRLHQFDLNIYQNGRSRKIINVAFDCIRCWLDDFSAMNQNGMGLYIFSDTKGSGKTRLVASLANELIREHNISVKFTTSVQIVSEIKASWDRGSDLTECELFHDLARAEVLIVDDFGVEKFGSLKNKDWIDSKFYQVLNDRCTNKNVTIFTSNHSLDSLPYESRIVSRIKEKTYQIPFPEESVREHISKKNMDDLLQRVTEFRKKEGKQLTIDNFGAQNNSSH